MEFKERDNVQSATNVIVLELIQVIGAKWLFLGFSILKNDKLLMVVVVTTAFFLRWFKTLIFGHVSILSAYRI